MMTDVNWWLMALAFVLGLMLTFAGTVRRVKREVPTYEALGPGLGDVKASATAKLRKVDGDATAKPPSGAATGAVAAGAAARGGPAWPCLGRLAAAAVTAIGGTGIALGVDQSSGPFGRALVVAFVLVAPALAIARLLPSFNAAVAVIVAAAGAAVINALVAQVMLSANAWSPPAGVIAVGLTAACLWLVPTREAHSAAPVMRGDCS
jgi:hypothetical protein